MFCFGSSSQSFRVKRGSYLGSEYHCMASGCISCVLLNFHPAWRLRPRCLVQRHQKSCPPSRWSCKAYKLYGSAGLCSPDKSIFARPKMITYACGGQISIQSLVTRWARTPYTQCNSSASNLLYSILCAVCMLSCCIVKICTALIQLWWT